MLDSWESREQSPSMPIIGRLETTYCGIVNPLQKLRYVFNEHNLESAPGLNDLQPAQKQYKKRPREEDSLNAHT